MQLPLTCHLTPGMNLLRSEKPVADDQVRRVQTVNGYYGHALKARDRVVIPAKPSACVATGLEFSPPSGVAARLQPLHGCGYDVCPAMYTYSDGAFERNLAPGEITFTRRFCFACFGHLIYFDAYDFVGSPLLMCMS